MALPPYTDPYGGPCDLFQEPVKAGVFDGDCVPITDARGKTLAFVPGDLTLDPAVSAQEAIRVASYLAAYTNLCADLRLEDVLAGRYMIAETNPSENESLFRQEREAESVPADDIDLWPMEHSIPHPASDTEEGASIR